jgi:F0F1-type ATP synthase gamma subunit
VSNLFGIKKKINSINKINKITESMKIVAISKINKLKRQFLNNTEYQQQLFEVLSDIPHDFLIPKTANKKL